ncbi:MAG: aldehyde dehydrogenase family protein, partial [Thermodesulfobacteriota bacterium]
RFAEVFSNTKGTFHSGYFENEPDTDWSLPGNRKWAESIRNQWKNRADDFPKEIPIVAAGTIRFQGREMIPEYDPNFGPEKELISQVAQSNEEDVDQAVAAAQADPDAWRTKSLRERHQILSTAADEMRRSRGDLIGVVAAETGKIFTEADVEVSEAVDFLEYYPHAIREFAGLSNLACRGKGVGVVVSPWNFPIAIPCGGVTAALATGNTVILKPASSAVMTAWELCRCFWNAGVSRNTLQFLPGAGFRIGSSLIRHPGVDFVIFTGGTESGLGILKQRPDLILAAETGGKNATIVTAMADRDQAVRNVVYSAFGNCGQKCSATSLLILEDEVYQSEHFRTQLVDAAGSMNVGSAWDFENRMGPLVRPPDGDLKHALTQLEPGEFWVLEPKNLHGNPNLWTPGIKYGVAPGSYTHMTEFFGPVLGVMRAKDLSHAIELANQTGYGLTSAIESLDLREQEIWKKTIQAGNLYINRGTTGAMVLRQPFGGMGKSAIGPGIKVGHSNYLSQFMDFEEVGFPGRGVIMKNHALLRTVQHLKTKLNWGLVSAFKEDFNKLVHAVHSYLYWYEEEFGRGKDYFHLRGQENILGYLPVGRVVVRLHEDDTLFETLARTAAAVITGCDPLISIPSTLNNRVTDFVCGREAKPFIGASKIVRQSDAELAGILNRIHRIRYAAPRRVSTLISKAAARSGFYISRSPVLMEGRIELLQYLRSQSICDTYHRYGNLGGRGI